MHGDSGLVPFSSLPPRLDAPVPPVIRKKPHNARSLAPLPRAISPIRSVPDTQREMIPSRIPPQRSGGDWRLPDRRLPDLRDALQAMFCVTQNGCTGGTLPVAARPRTPGVFFFWST